MGNDVIKLPFQYFIRIEEVDGMKADIVYACFAYCILRRINLCLGQVYANELTVWKFTGHWQQVRPICAGQFKYPAVLRVGAVEAKQAPDTSK